MAITKKKISTRRQRVRETLASDRFGRLIALINSPLPMGLLILACFVAATVALLGLDTAHEAFYIRGFWVFQPWPQIVSLGVIVGIIAAGAAFYIHTYQPRVIANPSRAVALASLFWLLLTATRFLSLSEKWMYLASGSAVACGIVLTIAYDQRFAIGMTLFYAILACFSVGKIATVELFLTMMSGIMVCCFSLREIRTRKKLIEVSLVSTVTVFVTAMALGVIQSLPMRQCFFQSGLAAGSTFAAGIMIQAFLPIIESAFGIATSMTLLDYSDANQPLLRKLAMDAPGTFSHSLLVGSMAEAAAESIGANGLLCRVGAYYHDIGKINKPTYFIENQMGIASRHEQLSPAMSQLVIVGHVKDGIEIADEFGLPVVLRQFIETHHGTTLMEYFYNEARKKQDDRQTPVSESEFRYPGPKPQSKEAAIVMLADAAESATRTLADSSPVKVETLVHTLAMKRLQDGQFDECELTLCELSRIEASVSKSLAAHHHGRIAYPKLDEAPQNSNNQGNGKSNGQVSPQ